MVSQLKQTNHKLVAQQATMEAKFMNQLAEAERQFEDKLHQLKTNSTKLQAQYTRLQETSNQRLTDNQVQLEQAREQINFQRHTISDLKSQLYHLEQEREDEQQHLDETKDDDKHKDKKDNSYDSTNKYNNNNNDDDDDNNNDSDKNDANENRLKHKAPKNSPPEYYYRKWMTLQDEYQVTRAKHAQEVQSWNQKVADLQTVHDDKVRALSDHHQQQLQELKDELAESQKRAASQEDYRRDEAEDLRILQDAQDATIAKLRNELEQERRHVELLKEQLQEKDEALLLLEREKKQALSSPPPSVPPTEKGKIESQKNEDARGLHSPQDQAKIKQLRERWEKITSRKEVKEGQKKEGELGFTAAGATATTAAAAASPSSSSSSLEHIGTNPTAVTNTTFHSTGGSSQQTVPTTQPSEKQYSSSGSLTQEGIEDRDEEDKNFLLERMDTLEDHQKLFAMLGSQLIETRTVHEKQIKKLQRRVDRLVYRDNQQQQQQQNHHHQQQQQPYQHPSPTPLQQKVQPKPSRTDKDTPFPSQYHLQQHLASPFTGVGIGNSYRTQDDGSILSSVRDLSSIAMQLRRIIDGETTAKSPPLECVHDVTHENSTIDTNSYYAEDDERSYSSAGLESAASSVTQGSI